MLSNPEKMILVALLFISVIAAFLAFRKVFCIITKGAGEINWSQAGKRFINVLLQVITMRPTFDLRIGVGIAHLVLVWGFLLFLFVNLGDVLEGLITGFTFPGTGIIGSIFRLMSDIFSAAVLIVMIFFLIRRFVLKDKDLSTRKTILLRPEARKGIQKDSAIVGVFIIFHIGTRLLGESIAIAQVGVDVWQPFASMLAGLWMHLPNPDLTRHIMYWLSLGSILIFIPYFPFTKHIHLFFAPLNLLLKPGRSSIGAMNKIDMQDERIETFGAATMHDLSVSQLMDAFACIMCYRCQEVCPAYVTGKVLSPAALEINKRYYLNNESAQFLSEESDQQHLTEWAIPEEAVWACTACGACIDICPVNNEPMMDILDIRRSLAMMDDKYPKPLQTAFRGLERYKNPWNVPQNERLRWAAGIHVPTIKENPEPELLWWVGCAPTANSEAQRSARAFAQLLNMAHVNYAVLGEDEHCTGDAARRAGREDIFYELSVTNVAILNEVQPQRIVTMCPHCLHTLLYEYPAFGGHYEVIHHTQFINELITQGQIKLKNGSDYRLMTYHDPCYLSRHARIIDQPRQIFKDLHINLNEMKNNSAHTFCCGAGGAQYWKEEENGTQRVSEKRVQDALDTGAEVLTVSCPFCKMMMVDAQRSTGSSLEVLDIAEIVLQNICDQ